MREETQSELLSEIQDYCDLHWQEIVRDIDALVRIPSTEDLDAAAPGAPFGPGPAEALAAALAIAERDGFSTCNCEGYAGYAELAGTRADAGQLGIIGHVDVVPAGPGWTVEPFAVTRKDGYLLGRGVMDDKGPLMVAYHALKFWKEREGALPFDVRIIFGANEETGMGDIAYYRAHFADPDFLFTPDSRFPVGYGESGILSGMLISAPVEGGQIAAIEGGQAPNAVPGEAHAVVAGAGVAELLNVAELPERIALEACDDGSFLIKAQGVSAHASLPEQGVNAIGLLVEFLLAAGIGNSAERAFLELLHDLHAHVDGEGLGIAAHDAHFGDLSVVGGVVGMQDARLTQSVDVRYPTTITVQQICERIAARAQRADAEFELVHDKEPFLMNPDSPAVQALLDAYNEVTGESVGGSTSKGGTYARCFTKGVSFGVEKPWQDVPAWVGGMHSADEGVSEDALKEAFAIYALAIGNLAASGLQ